MCIRDRHRNGDRDLGIDHGFFAGVGVIVEHDKFAVIPAGLELFFCSVQQLSLIHIRCV